ncbi:MAG: urea carboxylase [Proteobacteria bacterium]|nr:urea carboxylase [Pseudomonadota bacterium]MDA1244809.1 urea carboxylase [Pseudomonadota bacterium]
MFKRVLIANRGAIATRIIRTLKKLGIQSIVVYHEKDQDSLHVQLADIAVNLGTGTVSDTYLNQTKILEIALAENADAIHPGYGFLSENPTFVERCESQGICFVGPTPDQINVFGLKHLAREAAEQANVPLLPGSGVLTDVTEAVRCAQEIGFPVMLKSSAGGGGIGMQVCRDIEELTNVWDSVRRLSTNYFSNDAVFLEKFIDKARHIEVQIFGDGEGSAIALGERDCSAQRRNQKVIEESPAPNLDQTVRESMHRIAEDLMASVNYRNAGTVEFIFDVDQNAFYFLEVNTRLQVEHGVTEEVFKIDIVEYMLRLAAGDLPSLESIRTALRPSGHAIQMRLYAEDTQQDFQPSAGLLSDVFFPEIDGLRVDTWIEAGIEIPSLFDPMLGKLIVYKDTREEALALLTDVLEKTRVYGIETNLDYVASVLATATAQTGRLLTKTLSDHTPSYSTIRVLAAGTQTTIQDFPGRQGYWNVGVPPSGPMDSYSLRVANKLLENPETTAGLEMTACGPSLRFETDATIALTGADMQAELDGVKVRRYAKIFVSAGQTLTMGKVVGAGARAYLAVTGGIDCPLYLGSRATFTLGQFGGHVGRALRAGDVLHLGAPIKLKTTVKPRTVDIPKIPQVMELRVIYGPHGAPDFFTNEDITEFFASEWKVHFNSSRTGVRLIGPKPTWARASGGEAGMHPSNIHDNAYAFGAVDFTGDMPVILGPDGPSLGGFVCPATVITADLWKLGQLSPGQSVRFIPVSYKAAVAAEASQTIAIQNLTMPLPVESQGSLTLTHPIVKQLQWEGDDLICRLAGDHFLLVEVGPPVLDIARRFKVHALMRELERQGIEGVKELTPGIRSLQIHYDSQRLTLDSLLECLEMTVNVLTTNDLAVPGRKVYLPLSWDDEACKLAIQKYTQSVRPGAPWCPSNLEFIRRMNGLGSVDDVKKIVFDASYLVMGLGDVYLGAPVATPVDPRHRLVTTKYNPARTWTAENSVGIGGAYMCVYGMEGPGGYQFVGRTSQMWNRYKQTTEFTQPWLLRYFDQIQFYEVSTEELAEFRRDFPKGKVSLRIEETEFSLGDYQNWLAKIETETIAFNSIRERAFEDELRRWREDGQFTFDAPEAAESTVDLSLIPEGSVTIDSTLSGNVWSIELKEGDFIRKGETLLILESMKMEIDVQAQHSGVIKKIWVDTGQDIQSGQCLAWIEQQEESGDE